MSLYDHWSYISLGQARWEKFEDISKLVPLMMACTYYKLSCTVFLKISVFEEFHGASMSHVELNTSHIKQDTTIEISNSSENQ